MPQGSELWVIKCLTQVYSISSILLYDIHVRFLPQCYFDWQCQHLTKLSIFTEHKGCVSFHEWSKWLGTRVLKNNYFSRCWGISHFWYTRNTNTGTANTRMCCHRVFFHFPFFPLWMSVQTPAKYRRHTCKPDPREKKQIYSHYETDTLLTYFSHCVTDNYLLWPYLWTS